jgi:hypothetical protein
MTHRPSAERARTVRLRTAALDDPTAEPRRAAMAAAIHREQTQ